MCFLLKVSWECVSLVSFIWSHDIYWVRVVSRCSENIHSIEDLKAQLSVTPVTPKYWFGFEILQLNLDVVTLSVVVVVDFGPWVLPLSLNCSLAPFPSALPIRMQRIGWSYSSEKSNPRLPRQTGANRTVRLLKVLLQLAVKEGTLSYNIYIIRKLYII